MLNRNTNVKLQYWTAAKTKENMSNTNKQTEMWQLKDNKLCYLSAVCRFQGNCLTHKKFTAIHCLFIYSFIYFLAM